MSNAIRAVVTGAASGLGLALVKQLSATGAEVVGLDLPGPERAAVVADARAIFVGCDVSSQADWASAARAVAAQLGTVTLLALNAGVMTRRPQEDVDDDPLGLAGSPGYRQVFAVNVDGVVFGLAAMRSLLASGASVAVTASNAGIGGLSFDPYYAMTKHAVVGFVRSMAEPLGADGFRINALCPGGIDTAIVPHDLRAAVPAASFRPPGDVARSLLTMAATSSSGGTWLPGDDGRINEYVVPPPR